MQIKQFQLELTSFINIIKDARRNIIISYYLNEIFNYASLRNKIQVKITDTELTF